MIKVYTWSEFTQSEANKTLETRSFVTARNYQLIEKMKNNKLLFTEWPSGRVFINQDKNEEKC